MATSGAQAAPGLSCAGGPVANGVTISCSGNVDYGVLGDGDNVTVTLNPDAYVSTDGGRALDLSGNHNAVTLGAHSQLRTYDDNKAVNFDGSNNTMTLNGGSAINFGLGNNNSGTALDIDGDNVGVTLNGNSSVSIYGSAHGSFANTFAVNTYGAGNALTLNGGSSVTLNVYNGDKYARSTGASMGGGANTLTLNSGSIVNVETYNEGKYAETTGVRMYGTSSTLTLNGNSMVNVVSYNNKLGSNTTGVNMRADSAKLVLNGGSAITVTTSGGETYGETFGAEIASVAPTVTLNGGSTINVNGTGSSHRSDYTGLSVSSFGEDHASAGQVTLNDTSSINVTLSGVAAEHPHATGVLLGGGSEPAFFAMPSNYAPSLTLNGSSSINVAGTNEDNNANGYYIGVDVEGKGGVITLNGTSSINLDAAGRAQNGSGILINDADTTVVMNGASSINIGREDGNFEIQNGTGIDARGDHTSITLNDTASVRMNAYRSIGIRLGGYSSSLIMNGDSFVSITKYGNGVEAYEATNAPITLNDNAFIQTKRGNGIDLRVGSDNSVTLNGNAFVITLEGDGVSFDRQKYGSLTLNGRTAIVSRDGNGVFLDRSDNTIITLNGSSSISADGTGILVSGQRQYYNYDSHSWIYYGSRNTTINVNAGTRVVGSAGIVVRDNAEDTVINVSGLVEGTGGTAIDFAQALNSTLTLNTGAELVGSVLGNASARDNLILNGAGTLNSEVADFDYLGVFGGAGQIWNLKSSVDLGTGYAEIVSGQLSVNGDLTADEIYVGVGGTLGGSGTIDGNVIVAGLLSPGNSPGTLTVVGNVNFTPGSGFKVQVEGNKADLLNVIGGGTVTIDPGTSITMEFLGGVDGFVGDVISSGNPVVGTFTTFIGGVFDYSTPGFVSLTAASPASVNTGMTGGTTVGFTFLDAVIDNAENGIGQNKGIWGTGLYNQTNRSGMGGTKGADVQSQGLAMGGDVFGTDNFRVGLAGGYIDSTATTEGGGSETGIKGYNVAAYTSYAMGNTFMTAAATGAYQEQDVSRRVLVLGTVTTANSSPEAWTAGAGFSIGHTIPIQGSWTIVPRASIGWQHLARDGYSETGGGVAAMSIQDVSSDTVRGQVGAELGFTIKDPNAAWSVRPSIRAALAKEMRSGDSMVNGRFLASGGAFSGKLDDRDQTYAAIGAGADVVVGGGVTAFAQYDGAVGGDIEKSGGVRIGARFEW